MRGTLYIIGAGLASDLISLRALKVLKTVGRVFLDGYTGTLLKNGNVLKDIIQRDYHILRRREVEEEGCEIIFKALEDGDVALLVPGDALIATTHINLLIEARKRGYDVVVIPGVSIVSAAIGLSGLMIYKLGKVVTLTYPKNGIIYDYPYDVIRDNSLRNLHTLLLLEMDVESGVCMTVHEALKILLEIEEMRNEGVISEDRVVVGVSRLGGDDMKICPGLLRDVMRYDLGGPPHTLIITAPKLHFIEEEALKVVKDVFCR